MSLPFNQSYWVVPGKLLAGCYPGDQLAEERDQKLTGLLQAGIRQVISLMEPGEGSHSSQLFSPYEAALTALAKEMGITVAIASMPIRDMRIPFRPEMGRILDRIDASIAQGQPVYVHCWGGIGRTGTVVGCFLARHGYADGHQVLNMISDLRADTRDAHRTSPETNEQEEMVLSWVEGE